MRSSDVEKILTALMLNNKAPVVIIRGPIDKINPIILNKCVILDIDKEGGLEGSPEGGMYYIKEE